MDHAQAVLEFWFGELPQTTDAFDRQIRFWFGNGGDEAIRTRFSDLMRRAADGELHAWAHGPRGRLALILLLDQFPRNVYRGSARAFAQDERALALALSGMQIGADAALHPVERLFFCMPLQHSERVDVQEESVAAFRRLAEEAPEALRAGFELSLRFAEQHRQLIDRFGRFPHRNRALGRESTAEELNYLAGDPETFGQ